MIKLKQPLNDLTYTCNNGVEIIKMKDEVNLISLLETKHLLLLLVTFTKNSTFNNLLSKTKTGNYRSFFVLDFINRTQK